MPSCSVDYNGVVPEKFDVVNLSHLVDAEYGNQGLDFKMLNREGFAWTNCKRILQFTASCAQSPCPSASFQLGLHFLSTGMRRAVAACTPVSTRLASSRSDLVDGLCLQPEVYFRLGPGKELDPEVEKMKREFDRNRI
mgnify:FL=1